MAAMRVERAEGDKARLVADWGLLGVTGGLRELRELHRVMSL
jgi:hypothetical protein